MTKNVSVLFLALVLAGSTFSFVFGQTVLISPTGDGGFETGTTFAANGWTIDGSTTNNRYWVGSAPTVYAGSRCSFTSNSGTAWTNTNAAVYRHMYRNVTFPSNTTSITLSFYYKISTLDQTYDGFRLYMCETSYTPVTTGYPTGTQIGLTWYDDYTAWTQQTINLDPATYAGTSKRLVFTWRNDNANPRGLGALDNISLVYTSGIANPTSFTATAVSDDQIDLSWSLNGSSDPVIVAWNTTNSFGTPTTGTSYSVGSTINGTGTVLVNGTSTSYQHTGRDPETTYYYKAWSYHDVTKAVTYSSGVEANATTLAEPIDDFPWVETVETTSPTIGDWLVSGGTYNWTISSACSGYGVGSRSFLANFYNINDATPFHLYSPGFDISALSSPVVTFDYAYATYSGEVDQLDVYYSTNGGSSWTLLVNMPGGTSGSLNTGGTVTGSFVPTAAQWATQTLNLPSGTNMLRFTATSAYGNNLYVDNVTVMAPTPIMTLSEASYDFGLAYIGASNCTERTFTATNSGSGTLTISSAPTFTGSDPTQFALTDNNSYPISLTHGQTASWTVKFDPLNTASYGEKTANLSLVDNLRKDLEIYACSQLPDASYGNDIHKSAPGSRPVSGNGKGLPNLVPVQVRATNNISLRGFAVDGKMEDYFDTYTDFAYDSFGSWTFDDNDGSATYTITDVTFTNQGYTGSYIIFDPDNTSPALTTDAWQPYSGDNYAACFAATTPPNDDWLISPQLSFDDSPRISFFAKSVTDAYGLERIKVLYSTDGTTWSYLAGSATTYIEVPIDWYLYEYAVPGLANTSGYIAIQCVSNDAFVLMLDDFVAGHDDGITVPVELSSFTAVITVQNFVMLNWTTQSETNVSGFYLFRNDEDDLADAERINAFVSGTNTSQQTNYVFTDREAPAGYTYYYWLQSIDLNGEYEFHGPVSITLNDTQDPMPIIPLRTELQPVYPNPFSQRATISYGLAKAEQVDLAIYNVRGEAVRSLFKGEKKAGTYKLTWDGLDDNGRPVSSGIYFVRMKAGLQAMSRKLVVAK